MKSHIKYHIEILIIKKLILSIDLLPRILSMQLLNHKVFEFQKFRNSNFNLILNSTDFKLI